MEPESLAKILCIHAPLLNQLQWYDLNPPPDDNSGIAGREPSIVRSVRGLEEYRCSIARRYGCASHKDLLCKTLVQQTVDAYTPCGVEYDPEPKYWFSQLSSM